MVRYAFDDANRLVIRERDGATGRLRPVRIVEGTATTDRGNRLVYRSTFFKNFNFLSVPFV